MIIGTVLMIIGALLPILILYLQTKKYGPIGIIGGADFPTYWFLYRARLSGWPRCLIAFGVATLLSAVWCRCCRQTVENGVSLKTLALAMALSASSAVLWQCAECWRMAYVTRDWAEPIVYPLSVPLGVAAVVMLIALTVWYVCCRRRSPSGKGTALEMTIACLYVPAFFFVCSQGMYLLYRH